MNKNIKLEKEKVKCENCGCLDIEYIESTPDYGDIYYCSKKCYEKFNEKHIHRSLDIKKIEKCRMIHEFYYKEKENEYITKKITKEKI